MRMNAAWGQGLFMTVHCVPTVFKTVPGTEQILSLWMLNDYGEMVCTYTQTDVHMDVHVKTKSNGRAQHKGTTLDIDSKSLHFAYFHLLHKCTTFEKMKTKLFSLCQFFQVWLLRKCCHSLGETRTTRCQNWKLS